MRHRERRILLVAPQPFYQDRGTPIAVRQVLEALGEIGDRVDLLTYPVGEEVAMAHLQVMRTANPFGFRTVPIGFSLRKVLLDLPLTVALEARLRAETYTCIHAVEEAVFPAIPLGHAHGLPVLYDMQSSLPEHLQRRRLFRFPLVQHVLTAVERWALHRADLVVCSAGLASRVRQLAPKTRVREWHFPSTAVEPVGEERSSLRRELRLPSDDPVVLYSGNFEAYQGIAELLDAVPLVRQQEPKAIFLFVGAENGRTAAMARAGPLVESGALRVVARQPRAEVARYLAIADVLVSPRTYGDNLPLKVFDYLAAGRPIVATDIAPHRTVLDEDRAVLVQPDGHSLAQGIVQLLRDPGLAARLATAGREYAEQHLDWPGFVSSVAEIYDEVHGNIRVARH